MATAPHPIQQYWLPGYELSRQIVLRQIQYFLGPSATVRPYSLQGREGYMITGMPITKEQIDDLKRQSKEYERQQTIRMRARRSDTDLQDVDPDINSIVPVGGSRSHQHYRRHGHRDFH